MPPTRQVLGEGAGSRGPARALRRKGRLPTGLRCEIPKTRDAEAGRTLGSRKESLLCPPNEPSGHLHVADPRKRDPSWLGKGLQEGSGAPGQVTLPLSWREQLTLWSWAGHV